MKKVSLIKALTLFLGVLLLSASLFQCKKEGDIIANLDRTYYTGPDSTVYASFYDENVITPSDGTPNINDIIKFRGVQTILHEYCGTSNCHGGSIKPKFDTYTDIMKHVVAGDPSASELWQMITTNDFDRAMPPVNSSHEMNTKDKGIVYNWILNGAKERPNLADFRPAAIRLIVDGCGSANCHNQATATGAWARKGLIAGITSSDTTLYTYVRPGDGRVTLYCLLTKQLIRDTVWAKYKDSVRRFYSDTVAFASFRPYKTFGLPVSSLSTRGPLNSYDDILLDIMYPKNRRSVSASGSATYTPPVYTDGVTGKQYWVWGNHFNSGDCFIRKIDSTLYYKNVFSGAEASLDGSMSYDDGGLKPSEIALIKAWYFADPNIPDVWKYGNNNSGIFRYRSGKVIKK